MKASKRGQVIDPATREFVRQARRIEGFSLFDLAHAYVYARWTYFYIRVGTGQHPATRFLRPVVNLIGRLVMRGAAEGEEGIHFANTYHGKVVPFEAAAQLVTVNEDVSLRDLEPIIPYPLARDIILQNPEHIVALECPCRSARINPCLPLDVCLIVGEPFASLVAAHHPQRSRWISQQEAVDILRAEQGRGHVSHAYFKDAMLGRFYAICNCCSCCCGAMNAHRNGTPMIAASGYVARVDEELCAGCGECAEVCQFGAIVVDDGFARIDAAACMGCGVCVAHCPQEAISLRRDPAKGEPLEIQKLIAEAVEFVQA